MTTSKELKLKLGQLNMKDYANKFLGLLGYIVKTQYLLSRLTQAYKDMIEVDDPISLEEAIRKAK